MLLSAKANWPSVGNGCGGMFYFLYGALCKRVQFVPEFSFMASPLRAMQFGLWALTGPMPNTSSSSAKFLLNAIVSNFQCKLERALRSGPPVRLYASVCWGLRGEAGRRYRLP